MTQVQATDDGISVYTAGKNSPVNIIKAVECMPSLLSPLLQGIIDVYDPFSDTPEEPHFSPETEKKISYNSVLLYAGEIRDNSGLMSLVENVINEIDSQKPKSKDKFLYSIKQKYNNCRTRLLLENQVDLTNQESIHEAISKNADRLIHNVLAELFSTVKATKSVPVEIVEAAQGLIVCYGFINCKILEAPPSDH
ncbi:conserved hypothetical protein [Vibrio coralliirubri]|uniref:hypothetical protein n=2 Tax=Vibrio coralliirubri TaxID=1516159 RepID=UPI000631EC81|nr:hypothetical protein [Vibrio coralliirubri]CAH6912961.1 conserved hypothetical protein [Vibrio chagasii]CAH6956177.1 conserved hypothetical protein [Vibrio chagasii]CAH6987607.1 conserved hypothetical protein [Vibrio chagasii]CAH7234390.1 conserved hypothetical protein [Vibrio chagasii]CAH7297945.1 conserved hypothetical protein [Vibrio chagasii]